MVAQRQWVVTNRRAIELFDVEIDALTLDETVDRARSIVRSAVPSQHVVVNAAKLVEVAKNPPLRDIIRSSAIVNADGMSVVWASRILRKPLPERVAGVDLFARIVEAAHRDGSSVYFLGRNVGSRRASGRGVSRAVIRASRISGYHDGFWEDDEEVIRAVRAARPDYLFLGIPSPRKEFWLNKNLDALGVPFVMGVGGSFDVVAGKVGRAPRWVQEAGLRMGVAARTRAPPHVEALSLLELCVHPDGADGVVGDTMRSAVIAGARPNFVKIAPLLRSLDAVGVDTLLVHTGQHYDFAMSDSLFADLGIPEPDANLEVGSGSHATQTAAVMTRFEEWLDGNPVDQVVTVGDVNSTLACALVASKREIPVAHVEAGLRSFDRTMPEEINRIVVDARLHVVVHAVTRRRREPAPRGHRREPDLSRRKHHGRQLAEVSGAGDGVDGPVRPRARRCLRSDHPPSSGPRRRPGAFP